MSESPSARLRAATAELHQRVELGMDILHLTETPEGAISMLLRMEAFYRTLEPLLASLLRDRVPQEFLVPRVSGLRADLDALSPGWKALPAPEMPTLTDAIGALYVLEGAALGGQVIRRHLLARLYFSSAFFKEGVGPRWRAFRSLLDLCESYDAVEATAVQTFLAFERAVVFQEALVG